MLSRCARADGGAADTRTTVLHGRTSLSLTGLGLSCAILVTPCSKCVNEQALRPNRCMRAKRAVSCLMHGGSG